MPEDKIDKIIQKLIEQDEKIKGLVTKMEFRDFAGKMTGILEDMATRVKRIDEDRVLTYQWVKRIEEKVEQHDAMLHQIKMHLKV